MTTATKTIEISHANGEPRQYAASMDVATMMLEERYGDEIVIFEDWESATFDGSVERKLVWANEDDADNDNGSNSVAEIIRRLITLCHGRPQLGD